MLRNSADWRSVVYLVLVASLGVMQWQLRNFHIGIYALYLFMSITVAVMSHNHNHVSMWKWKPLNLFTNYVISLHFGYPAIAWVPTHNQNHHKFNNREGDTGRSPGFFKGNHLLSLLTYPFLTGIRQQRDMKAFFKQLWAKNRTGFWLALSEYVVFLGVMVLLLVINCKKALIFYFIPQQFGLFYIQTVNYIQHVETETESEWNHSRNFVSPVLNTLLFNNGYHTVHHLKPGVHWSQIPGLHAQHVHKIHPDLLVRSWWMYMLKTFFGRPLVKAQRSIRTLAYGLSGTVDSSR
jgi:beta-carotene hydroxylase